MEISVSFQKKNGNQSKEKDHYCLQKENGNQSFITKNGNQSWKRNQFELIVARAIKK